MVESERGGLPNLLSRFALCKTKVNVAFAMQRENDYQAQTTARTKKLWKRSISTWEGPNLYGGGHPNPK
jgi:hypothetical protein